MKLSCAARMGGMACAVFLISTAILSRFAFSQDNAQKIQTLMAEADAYAEKTFEDQKAVETYEKILKLDPNNYDALWKASRSMSNIGARLPIGTDEEKQKALAVYEKGLDYANRAIAANPNGSMGHVRRAVIYGRMGLLKGVWDSIDLVKKTRSECEKAIQLDLNNATAWYVLGRTHMKVSEKPKLFRLPLGLGWANMEDAITDLEKSVRLRPDFIMFRLDLARAYAEEDEYSKAREQINKIKTLPTQDAQDGKFRTEADQLLKEIQNK